MLGEELFNPTIEVELVFRPTETVPLVRIDYVGHFPLCFTQRCDHRVSISQCDSRIVLALHDQKRSPDRIDMIKRRDFSIPLWIMIGISLAPSPTRHNIGPIFRKGTKTGGFVGWPKFINATRKEIRPHFQRAQRGETSHRSSHRRDSLWISDPLIHGPTHSIQDVFDHPKPNLKITSIEELDAETGRAAIVRLQNGIAAVGEKLRLLVIVVGITSPWATMNQKNQRQLLRLHAGRRR